MNTKLDLHIIACAILLTAASAGAQTGTLAGPVAGYLLDRSAVRPILGIPGASVLGGRRPLGFETRLALVSPRQNYVLAATGAGVSVVPLAGERVRTRGMRGMRPDTERMVMSPTGSSALLAGPAGAWAQVIKGLPDAPAASGLDLAGLPGIPGALAVSDDGAAVLAASGGTVYLISAGKVPRPLPAGGEIASIAFFAGSHDALVAGRGQVGILSDVTGTAAFRLFPAIEGLDNPVGLWAASGGRAFVASSRAVWTVEVGSGSASAVACSCTITGLAPLGDSVFRLNEPSDDPLWLLDAGGPQARMVFVPPVAAGSQP